MSAAAELARRLQAGLDRLLLGDPDGPILGPPATVLVADPGEGTQVCARILWGGCRRVEADRLIDIARACGARRVDLSRLLHGDRAGVVEGRDATGAAHLTLWCEP